MNSLNINATLVVVVGRAGGYMILFKCIENKLNDNWAWLNSGVYSYSCCSHHGTKTIPNNGSTVPCHFKQDILRR